MRTEIYPFMTGQVDIDASWGDVEVHLPEGSGVMVRKLDDSDHTVSVVYGNVKNDGDNWSFSGDNISAPLFVHSKRTIDIPIQWADDDDSHE